jgi:hypothetical protein
MQHSNDSVAALAPALARAQAELVNPEKSLTGIIRTGRPGKGKGRTFRYAPAFWPAGTFARAYQANRRAAVEELIEADPLAADTGVARASYYSQLAPTRSNSRRAAALLIENFGTRRQRCPGAGDRRRRGCSSARPTDAYCVRGASPRASYQQRPNHSQVSATTARPRPATLWARRGVRA